MEENNVAQNFPQTQQPVENQAQVSKPASRSKLPMMLIGFFILLIVLGSGAYYYLGVKTKNTNQQKQTSIAPTIAQKFPTPSIDSTASPDSTPIQSGSIGANWKTYINERYGFSFKYPSNYNSQSPFHNSSNGQLLNSFSDNINEGLYVYVNKPVKEYVYDLREAGAFYRFNTDKKEWVSIAGNVPDPSGELGRLAPKRMNTPMESYFVRFGEGGCGGGKSIIFPSSYSYVIEIVFDCVKAFEENDILRKQAASKLDKTMDQILSTFKFTPALSAGGDQNQTTANWKTYKNNIIGFQMQYPSDYQNATENPGVQAWTFTPDWGTVNFYRFLNQNLYTLIFFPFTGSLDDLLIARRNAASIDFFSQKHPAIPYFFDNTPETLVKTISVGGLTGKWYSSQNLMNEEIHFIGNNHGFIFKPSSYSGTTFDEKELDKILSTFRFAN